jgi:hypothetical protein
MSTRLVEAGRLLEMAFEIALLNLDVGVLDQPFPFIRLGLNHTTKIFR